MLGCRLNSISRTLVVGPRQIPIVLPWTVMKVKRNVIEDHKVRSCAGEWHQQQRKECLETQNDKRKRVWTLNDAVHRKLFEKWNGMNVCTAYAPSRKTLWVSVKVSR